MKDFWPGDMRQITVLCICEVWPTKAVKNGPLDIFWQTYER